MFFLAFEVRVFLQYILESRTTRNDNSPIGSVLWTVGCLD